MAFPSHSRPTYAMGGLVWLLVFFSFFTTEYAANPKRVISSGNPLNEPPNDARVRRADPPCPANRLYLCIAYDAIGEPYPDWLKTQCYPCETSVVCTKRNTFSLPTGRTRPELLMACRPTLCTDEPPNQEFCITPVPINGGKILLPFNLCTREMMVFGDCDDKIFTTEKLALDKWRFTHEYFLQCDAGFTVPRFAATDEKGGTLQPASCVPSLQQAAGFLKDDQSPLQNYPYDVLDPLQFTYCGKGGRPSLNSTCQPLPLCSGDRKTVPTSAFGSTEVILAKDCDLPCPYQFNRTDYSDCVFLDLVDPIAKRFYSARRAMSGPYAELMSEGENLLIGVETSSVEAPSRVRRFLHNFARSRLYRMVDNERNGRVARQSNVHATIRYPKCINTTGLAPIDLQRVENDLMLNCTTNIFVQLFGEDGLRLDPPVCDGYDDLRICQNRADPPPPTSTVAVENISTLATPTADATADPIDWESYATVVAVGVVALAVVVIGGLVLYLKRLWCFKRVALPLPDYHPGRTILLQEGTISGSWMDPFHRTITAKPVKRKPGRELRFATKGHVALQAVQKQSASDKAPDDIVCETPNDPPAVAQNILKRLADDYWVCTDAKGTVPMAKFAPAELLVLFERAREISMNHRGVVRIKGPVWIVGNLDGDFVTAWRIFKAYSTMAAEGTKMLFLGNIGTSSLDNMMSLVLVAAAMVAYPESVFYLCGSSESAKTEVTSEETSASGESDPNAAINALFAQLPLFASIDGRILAMHGGLCPELKRKHLGAHGFDLADETMKELRLETVTSDPNYFVKEYTKKKNADSGYLFGAVALEKARHELRFDFMIRGHQAATNGVKFYGNCLISLHSTYARIAPPKQKTIKAPKAMSAVLEYDGCTTFKMIHFVDLKEHYGVRCIFEQEFDYANGKDTTFAERNVLVNETEEPDTQTSSSDGTKTKTPTADTTETQK